MDDTLEPLCGTTRCDYFLNFYIPDIENETLFSLDRSYLMPNHMKVFLYEGRLRCPHLSEANYTILGVSLKATAMNEHEYTHSSGYGHLC